VCGRTRPSNKRTVRERKGKDDFKSKSLLGKNDVTPPKEGEETSKQKGKERSLLAAIGRPRKKARLLFCLKKESMCL